MACGGWFLFNKETYLWSWPRFLGRLSHPRHLVCPIGSLSKPTKRGLRQMSIYIYIYSSVCIFSGVGFRGNRKDCNKDADGA